MSNKVLQLHCRSLISLMDRALGATDFRDNGVQGLWEKVIKTRKKFKKLQPKKTEELKGK